MADKKTDGRVKYTKMVIKNSFIALLKEKPLAKVTVTEICQRADVNRATFYAHYLDPVDLLDSIETELIEDVIARMENVFPTLDERNTGTLIRVFEYIRENSEICNVLLSDSGDTSFQAKVVGVLKEQFLSAWTVEKSVPTEDAEYLYIFAALGSVGMIRKWLADGMTKTPAEMAELVIKLAAGGYAAF